MIVNWGENEQKLTGIDAWSKAALFERERVELLQVRIVVP